MGKKWSMEERSGTSYAAQREEIYRDVQDYLRDVTGRKVSLAKCRELFDVVTQGVVAATLRDGAFRLNEDVARFERQTLPAKIQRLPTGETVEVPARSRIRLHLGATGKALDEEGGDLDLAFAARGLLPARGSLESPD